MADTPDKDSINSVTKEHQAEEKHQNTSPVLRAKFQIPHSVINNYQTEQKTKNRFERWKFGVEIFTLLVIGTYTVIVYHQWNAMREATDAAKKSANAAKDAIEIAKDTLKIQKDSVEKTLSEMKVQSRAMQINAAAAKSQAKISDNALRANIEAGREDRRPWVGLRDFRCEDCTDADGNFRIASLFGIMENTGKTPATRMVISATLFGRKAGDPIAEYDRIQESVKKWHSKTSETVLPPNTTRILPIVKSEQMPLVIIDGNDQRTEMVGRIELRPDKKPSIEDREIIYVVGKITYYGTERDRQYVTSFCLMNDFGNDFHFCPSGNDMK